MATGGRWILRPRRPLATAVAVMAVITAGCGGGPGDSGGGDRTLRLATSTPGAYSSFNPWSAGFGINNSLWISQALYDSLVHLDAEGNPTPSVATSWSVDGELVTLELRTDITFKDGTPLDAEAVKANLDHGAKNPAGAECNARIEGITTTVLSPTSVRLKLPHAMPALLQNLGQCAGFIVNPKALSDDSQLKTGADGTGPYTVDSSATNMAQSKFVFVKNPDYWDDANAAQFDKITLTGYTDRAAAVNSVRGGQADVLANQPPREVSVPGVEVSLSKPQLLTGAWIMDTTGEITKPLGSVLVRQAMNYALDREALGTGLYGKDFEITGSTPFPEYYVGHDPSLADRYPYDPDRAKQLLSEAGYPNGISVPTLISPLGQQVAEATAGYLEKVGIKLELSVHSSDFIPEMLSGKWPLVFANYTLNPAQLQTIQGVVGPNGFWNPRHNADPKVAALVKKIESTTDEGRLTELYGELATVIADQALLLTPFILPAATAYDGDEVELSLVPGLPVPLLYDIKPVGED